MQRTHGFTDPSNCTGGTFPKKGTGHMTIDLTKAKYEFVDSLLGIVMPMLGGVVDICKQVDPAPDGLGAAAIAAFDKVRDLRASVQTHITSYDLAA